MMTVINHLMYCFNVQPAETLVILNIYYKQKHKYFRTNETFTLVPLGFRKLLHFKINSTLLKSFFI